ncbi:MAG: BNR-4 repeat-containing protein [Planctomycetes bacterium]|nr:BNR-4 repeat-containing protein [Planctomycetota bacterium]
MRPFTPAIRAVASVLVIACGSAQQDSARKELPVAPGFRGIWYSNQPTGDEHRYKYSGGFGTYPQQHVPIAAYDPVTNRTWLVLGGTDEAGELLHLVAWLDHDTFTLSRPRILLRKGTTDAHDNPTLALDPAGRLYVFSNSHGTARPSFVHRSGEPAELDRFTRTWTTNFSYGQPWWIDAHGLVLLHTLYRDGRRLLHLATSPDGVEWSEPTPFAVMDRGHYQVSWSDGRRIATAFDRHPEQGGLNARTDLHYAESRDGGITWTTAAGAELSLPLRDPRGPSLVEAFSDRRLLVYLKDVAFDVDGSPIVLFATVRDWRPGPAGGPRRLATARFDRDRWVLRDGPEIDHAYDHGSLLVDPDGDWRLIAPTGPGPRPWATGGEIELWRSGDRGASWERVRSLTPCPGANHTYVRKVWNAHPDCEVVWADGDPLAPSPSRFWFATRDGRVFALPWSFDGPTAAPIPLTGS